MLFTFGALAPELLAVNGGDVPGSVWFETGKTLLDGDSLKWFIVPFGQVDNPLPLVVVAAAQVALMGGAEFYRKQGSVQAGFAPGVGKFDESVFDGVDPLYPGGPFDPLGLADDPDVFAELKVKEIKNGRLAMFSMFGFFVQAIVTGEGPIANLVRRMNARFPTLARSLSHSRFVLRASFARQNSHLADPTVNNGFANATKFVPGN